MLGAEDDLVLCAGELLRLDLSLFGVFLSPLVSSFFPADFSVSKQKHIYMYVKVQLGFINILSRGATVFHRPVKHFELNFFIKFVKLQ